MRSLRPWNVKPGMMMRIGITPNSSALREVVDVEKTRGKVTGQRCWRITLKLPWELGNFKYDSVLRFSDQRCEVE